MTIADWLAARQPAPPPALRARLATALGAAGGDEQTLTAERCLSAAEAILATLGERDDAGREAAMDLLAADALVTYAFEAAAADPATLDERTANAMMRLARLAGG